MATDTRDYPFAIAAGGMQILPVHGEKFLVRSTTGPVDVRWKSGRISALLAGQGYNVRKGFDQLTLNNPGALPIVGVVQVADDDFLDKRITGDVSVIDGEKARTLAGGRFMGACQCLAGGAAIGSLVQIWNPSTTKNLVLTSVQVVAFANLSVSVFGCSLQLANASPYIGNAKLGAASGVGLLRTEQCNAARNTVLGNAALGFLAIHYIGINTARPLPLSGPIVCPPATGLIIRQDIFNVQLDVNFEWFEEDV